MKIIIGSHNILSAGGSEEHARTLQAEFARRGHDAILFAMGMPKTPEHHGPAFLSHSTIVGRYLERNPESKCIQTIHGLVPQLEQPVRDERVKHVAVSQEIADAYKDLDCTVILNGVDLERFSPSHRLPKVPRRLLCLAQSESFAGMICRICERRGIEFRAKNKFVNPTYTVEHDMQWSDIVVGIGRSAIEAAACGRMVILADHRPYQDAMTDGFLSYQMYKYGIYSNLSGRKVRQPTGEATMEMLIQSYMPEYGDMARSIAVLHHDIRAKAQEYLDVWNSFTGDAGEANG